VELVAVSAHTENLRRATAADLDAINTLIEAAIGTWDLPDRVKRLSLASYRYHSLDLEHLELSVAEDATGAIVGVAAWEKADPRDAPEGARALLLHGIYVAPDLHGGGIGSRLVEVASSAARAAGFDGLLVKAHPSACGFFEACGFQRLAVTDPSRDYPHRFWRSV